jgi:glycosyltransferase involved in cell wall biosynthesis
MRTLHIAALAFPTPQGTQAALHGMLSALAAHGHDTHLLCYPERPGGAAPGERAPYTIHRVDTSLKQRSTRSGPSLDKVLLDFALARHAARLCAELAPDLVIAHHVEGALCGLALAAPVLFVAHTSLRTELPSYFAAPLAPGIALAGAWLDRFLCARHPGALAVSPLLAEMLTRESERTVTPIQLPWQVAEPADHRERSSARECLELSSKQPVALYAGNLDAYQGLEALLPSLNRLVRYRPTLTWLIATESPTRGFARKLAALGLDKHVKFTALADERARRRVHAAADVALVPRGAAGGIPIKLLDALARGLPVVTSRTACAGMALPDEAVTVVEDFGGWDVAIDHVLDGVTSTEPGRAFIATRHAGSRFVSDLIAHARNWQLLPARPG